jgi:PAS domain S-box-containing protein
MDKDGNYEWINESLKKMYGITPDELYAWKGRSLLSTSYTGEINAVWNRCVTEKKSVTYQALARKYKGEEFWTQTTLTPILGTDGEVVKVIGIDTDISKIKQAEEKIKYQSEELSKNLRELQQKTQMISQSIEYAEKIQKAILHNESHLQEIFPESFVLLMPRDVVSGDFCWFFRQGNHSVIVAADCTGHGVPGAFMSLIGSSLLNEVIREKNIMDPSRILSEMNEKTIAVLRQKQQGENIQEDGLDVAVCAYNSATRQLTFAGASMPLVLYNSDGLVKVHGDLFSIGGTFSTRKNVRFKNQVFDAAQFDGFFLFSDGYQDQFGGGENRKFMADSFSQLLGKISELKAGEQKEQLIKNFSEWKGDARQIDDVLVIGCKFR